MLDKGKTATAAYLFQSLINCTYNLNPRFIKPDIFPIIDVRAYRALTGKKPYYATYSYDEYVKYTKELMRLADLDSDRTLREMDE